MTSNPIAVFTPTSKLAFARRILDRAMLSRVHSYSPAPSISEFRSALEALDDVETHLREKGGQS